MTTTNKGGHPGQGDHPDDDNNVTPILRQVEPADPFSDLASLRAPSGLDIATERVLSTVPVRKPKRDEWFRVHPDDEYADEFLVVEHEADMDREVYLILPAYVDCVPEGVKQIRLFTCINRRDVLFLWPAKLPAENNAGRAYAESGLRIANDAKRVWSKMWGDRGLGAYAHIRAKGNLPEPKWPDKPFLDLIRIAFRDRLIDRADHPLIRELNGEL